MLIALTKKIILWRFFAFGITAAIKTFKRSYLNYNRLLGVGGRPTVPHHRWCGCWGKSSLTLDREAA